MPKRNKGAEPLKYQTKGGGRTLVIQASVNKRVYDGVKDLENETGLSKSELINRALEKAYPSLREETDEQN